VRSSDGGPKHRQKEYDQVVLTTTSSSEKTCSSSITTTLLSGQLSAAMTSGYQQAEAFWDYVVGKQSKAKQWFELSLIIKKGEQGDSITRWMNGRDG
jgi:hypothetical protein